MVETGYALSGKLYHFFYVTIIIATIISQILFLRYTYYNSCITISITSTNDRLVNISVGIKKKKLIIIIYA